MLTRELAAAVGLGGRGRRASSGAERARLTVTKRIKDALGRVSESHAPLGAYLSARIRTGFFCSYTPDPSRPVSFEL